MIILFFYYYFFSDDIIEELKNFEKLIKKIKFKYNLSLQNKKYNDKKEEQKKYYEEKNLVLKRNTEKRIK